ncbi:hypothetical protein EDD18DRAFT_1215719 [Armillaria luteobubalina]|uniref:Uncharacterized protein n=1 Tax=Armillaria luteobubalina TaxID=153913 RepID=A0AA39P3J9_9AGAR|nr:hypothetical protein EDD18DRAFT_1215719 [Armillaria luteobubalina]
MSDNQAALACNDHDALGSTQKNNAVDMPSEGSTCTSEGYDDLADSDDEFVMVLKDSNESVSKKEVKSAKTPTGGSDSGAEERRRENARIEDGAVHSSKTAQILGIKELRGVQDLLDVRTRELQDARTFLDTGDLALNAEIFQTAAYMADSSVFGAKPLWLGADFGRNTEARVQCVQVALQASLVRSCMATIAMWHPDPNIDEKLRLLYSMIRKNYKGLAPVAGRWRMMTRSKSKYSTPEETEKPYIPWMVRKAILVLLLAGWDSDGTKLGKHAWTQSWKNTGGGYGISRYTKASFRKTLSSASQLAQLAKNQPQYDPGAMENADGPAEKVQPSDRVMCTSDLGLKVTEACEDGTSEGEAYLLKPKVVLRSSLA